VANGLASTGNGVGTTGFVNGITGTEGLPPSTSAAVVNGFSGAPNVVLPGVQLGGIPLLRDTAYGYSLPAAPPPPGRGGPTFIGEERGDATIITLPNQ